MASREDVAATSVDVRAICSRSTPVLSQRQAGIEKVISAPPSAAVGGSRSAAVGARDRVDDRQPEPGAAARARDVGAAEALERVREEVRRKARAGVADAHRDHAVLDRPHEPHRSRAVTQRVVDEVAERLLETNAISGDDVVRGRRHLELPSGRAGLRVEAPGDRVEDLAQVVRREAQRQASVVGAGEHEQVLGQPHEPLDLLRGRAQRVLQLWLRARPAQRQLELGAEGSERRPQLVARVRDEAPLSRQPLLQPTEHLVQGLSEPPDLVVGRRQRKPLVGALARDLGRLPPHRLDRPERGAGEEVATDRGQEQRQRPDHDELREEPVERLLPVLERRPDDEGRSPAVELERADPQTRRFAGEVGRRLSRQKERA